jgi:hypothetical protein
MNIDIRLPARTLAPLPSKARGLLCMEIETQIRKIYPKSKGLDEQGNDKVSCCWSQTDGYRVICPEAIRLDINRIVFDTIDKFIESHD